MTVIAALCSDSYWCPIVLSKMPKQSILKNQIDETFKASQILAAGQYAAAKTGDFSIRQAPPCLRKVLLTLYASCNLNVEQAEAWLKSAIAMALGPSTKLIFDEFGKEISTDSKIMIANDTTAQKTDTTTFFMRIFAKIWPKSSNTQDSDHSSMWDSHGDNSLECLFKEMQAKQSVMVARDELSTILQAWRCGNGKTKDLSALLENDPACNLIIVGNVQLTKAINFAINSFADGFTQRWLFLISTFVGFSALRNHSVDVTEKARMSALLSRILKDIEATFKLSHQTQNFTLHLSQSKENELTYSLAIRIFASYCKEDVNERDTEDIDWELAVIRENGISALIEDVEIITCDQPSDIIHHSQLSIYQFIEALFNIQKRYNVKSIFKQLDFVRKCPNINESITALFPHMSTFAEFATSNSMTTNNSNHNASDGSGCQVLNFFERCTNYQNDDSIHIYAKKILEKSWMLVCSIENYIFQPKNNDLLVSISYFVAC